MNLRNILFLLAVVLIQSSCECTNNSNETRAENLLKDTVKLTRKLLETDLKEGRLYYKIEPPNSEETLNPQCEYNYRKYWKIQKNPKSTPGKIKLHCNCLHTNLDNLEKNKNLDDSKAFRYMNSIYTECNKFL